MVIKSCPLLMKDTETCVGSSLASYFVLLSFVLFYFVFISLISSRFVSFLLISFRFVSFRFVFVDFVSFRFVSFRFYFVSHFIGTYYYVLLNWCVVHDYEMNVCILYVVDLKGPLELVLVIIKWMSTLNKTLNWIEFKINNKT